MSQYLPRYKTGDSVPVTLSATVVGGTLITTLGATAADASTTVAGVAGFDGVSGQTVTTWREGLQIGTASGAIANGQPLCAAAGGKVRVWVAGTDAQAALIGRAWSAAADTASVTYALINV
jgi:hypothetical protein